MVPYAFREQVESELEKMVAQGILRPVKSSEWATPLVVVPKPGGKVRICGDYSVSVNPQVTVEHYPLPRVDEVFNNFRGCGIFAILDLKTAYLQLALDEASRKLLTVTTHLGLFEFLRMPYGVSSAPAIFQSVMDKILLGLTKVACYLDDVLVGGVD